MNEHTGTDPYWAIDVDELLRRARQDMTRGLGPGHVRLKRPQGHHDEQAELPLPSLPHLLTPKWWLISDSSGLARIATCSWGRLFFAGPALLQVFLATCPALGPEFERFHVRLQVDHELACEVSAFQLVERSDP